MTNEKSNSFTIKYPSGIPSIIFFGITTVNLSIQLILMNRNNDKEMIYSFLSIILICMLLLSLILLAVTIRRLFMKSSVLIIQPESLFLHGRSVEAGQMERIMVMGYFKPILGIKPIGRKMVPLDLTFRFIGDVTKGEDELSRWAKHNQIPMTRKQFMRWW